MAEQNTFEDLEVWKTGRIIANDAYDLSCKGPFSRDFVLKDQFRDSCLSISSNIAEGFERDGDSEKIQFLSYAKGSAGEARSQLYIAYDRKFISEEEFTRMKELLMSESRMISGYMKYLKDSKFKGRKYK